MNKNEKLYKKVVGFRSLVFCIIFVLLFSSVNWAGSNVSTPDAGPADYYAVAYDGNGVEGLWTDNGVTSQEVYTIKGSDETGIANTYLKLKSWNTEKDGSGAAYSPGDQIIVEEFITLYAQWQMKTDLDFAAENMISLFDVNRLDRVKDTVVVTYNWPNGTFTDSIPIDEPYKIKDGKSLGASLDDLVVTHWSTTVSDVDGSIYIPGKEYSIKEDIILHAIYEKAGDGRYSITYARTEYPRESFEHFSEAGTDYIILDLDATGITPLKNFEFKEWNLMHDGTGESFLPEAEIKGLNTNITLYARWDGKASNEVLIHYISNGSEYSEQSNIGENYTFKFPEELGLTGPEGTKFAGWQVYGTTDVLQAGESIELNQTPYILEALWEPEGNPDDYYYITYDGNGGVRAATGESSYRIPVKKGSKDHVYFNDFHHADETLMFIGWNSQINGEGNWYDQGQEVTIQGDITLYAQWGGKNEYTDVIYHGNGGTISGSSATTYIETVERNSVYRAKANMFAYSGNNFQRWDTTANGSGTPYLPNAQVPTDTATVNLYAQWKESGGNGGGGNGGGSNPGGSSRNTYDVIYHANNGTEEANIKESYAPNATVTTKAGSVFTAPGDQVFRGWATSETGEVVYLAAETFSMPSRDMDLYAVWEQLLSYDDHFAYIVGYEDGTVGPGRNVTREEVATIFYRLLTDEARSNYRQATNSFSDVTEDRWSNVAISTLANARIVNGYEDGTFKPGNAVTRAELAVIAAIFDNSPDTEEDLFSDIAGHWAGPYINRAAFRGWVSGYNDGTFQPGNNITRAELVTLVNKVLRREPKDSSSLLPDMATFVDNMDTTQWYYLAIQEAANSHDYDADGSKEIWTELRTNRDWLQLERP